MHDIFASNFSSSHFISSPWGCTHNSTCAYDFNQYKHVKQISQRIQHIQVELVKLNINIYNLNHKGFQSSMARH